MVDCGRCGYTHAPGHCPIAGGVAPMPRATPSPTYAVAMHYLEARTLPTSGAGNLCLFYALGGDMGAGGRLGGVLAHRVARVRPAYLDARLRLLSRNCSAATAGNSIEIDEENAPRYQPFCI